MPLTNDLILRARDAALARVGRRNEDAVQDALIYAMSKQGPEGGDFLETVGLKAKSCAIDRFRKTKRENAKIAKAFDEAGAVMVKGAANDAYYLDQSTPEDHADELRTLRASMGAPSDMSDDELATRVCEQAEVYGPLFAIDVRPGHVKRLTQYLNDVEPNQRRKLLARWAARELGLIQRGLLVPEVLALLSIAAGVSDSSQDGEEKAMRPYLPRTSKNDPIYPWDTDPNCAWDPAKECWVRRKQAEVVELEAFNAWADTPNPDDPELFVNIHDAVWTLAPDKKIPRPRKFSTCLRGERDEFLDIENAVEPTFRHGPRSTVKKGAP